MTREEMMDEIIRIYGFENPYTLLFCDICERRANDEMNIFFIEQLFCSLIGDSDKYVFEVE